MSSRYDEWLDKNPAYPAFPTLNDAAELLARCNRRPSNGSIALGFEPTPWGGVERVKMLDSGTDQVRYEAVQLTVLPGLFAAAYA